MCTELPGLHSFLGETLDIWVKTFMSEFKFLLQYGYLQIDKNPPCVHVRWRNLRVFLKKKTENSFIQEMILREGEAWIFLQNHSFIRYTYAFQENFTPNCTQSLEAEWDSTTSAILGVRFQAWPWLSQW